MNASSWQRQYCGALAGAYVKGAEAFKQTKIDLEVETALRKLGAGATDAQRAAVEALARSEATAKATTKDLQDQDAQYAKDKEKSAQLEEKRLNEAEKRAEKVAHEMANAIASESQKASTAVVDAFFDGFDSIKNYAIKTAKEIAAAMLIRPIIQPIIAGAIGSLTGGVGGGGGALGGVANGASLGSAAYTLGGGSAGVFGGIGAGVGNYIDTLGANYLGTGAAANSVPLSQLGTANLTGATLSSLLGGAAIGGLAGNLLVGLWGGNKTVGTIGGAATGVSAAALGLTNPITGVLAALTILGSLFGNKPSDKTAESNLDLGSGAISAVPGVGDKFDQGNLDRANALTGTVGNFTNFFQSFGAKAQGRVFFDVGSRDGIRAAVGGDQARFGADDAGAAAAISFVVKKIAAQMGDQLPKELQTALDHVDFSSTAAISKSLDQLAVIKQFLDLQKEIAGQAEPMSQAETVYRNTHTQIEALAEQVKALGISADEANGLIDTFDATFRTKYTKDMTATLNEVTGRGFLNQIQGALDEHKTNVHDAGVFGTDVGIADKIEGGRLASILGGLTSDQLAVVQQMFANVPEVVAALGRASGALAATAAAATTAAAAQTAQATALADMNAAYDKRLSDLDDETRALQSTASAWASVNAQMQAFSAGLLIDPSLSPLGLGDQVTEAKRQLQDTYAKAQGGDVNAAAAFPDLARRFLQLDKQYDTTSAAYAQNFAMVQSMASQIQSTAGAQVSVASQQLTVLGQIRDALVAQRGAINGGTAAATRPATTAADANALNQLYNAARGSQTDAAFLSGPSGASWIAARDQSIAGQTDANYLLSVLPAARSQQTTPGLEAVGSSFEAAIASRLRELGVPVPAYADGGPIMRTGLAYVHAGEHVSSQADMSTLNAKLDRLCGLFEGMISGSMTAAEVHAAHLEAIADNTAKTANAPYDTAVLAAAAGRSRVLK